jgi:hypothetical protein
MGKRRSLTLTAAELSFPQVSRLDTKAWSLDHSF